MERPIYVPMFEDMLLALDCLDDGELRKALAMVRAYYFDGVEPTDDRSPARAMFLGFKASMDKTLARSRANSANGKRKAKARKPESEPEANVQPAVPRNEANGMPSRTEILAKAHEPKRTEAKPERTRAKAQPAVPRNDSEPEASEQRTEANGERNEAKPHKTKDQRPRTKDQEEKSVAHARKPPRPLRRFKPPETEEEQAAFTAEAQAYGDAYCIANGLPEGTFDASRFADHFASNGWRVGGKAPMRDWRASVRNWIRNDHPQLGGGAKQDGWADKYVPDAIEVDG